MDIVEYNTSHTSELSIDPEADQTAGVYEVYVTLIHDWGQTVVAETRATRDGPGEYSYDFSTSDLQSSGVYKVLWRWEVLGDDYRQTQHFEVVRRYVIKEDFFEMFPEFEEEYADDYEKIEDVARKIIDAFCGQDFQVYKNLYLKYDGNGEKEINLGMRLSTVSEVIAGSDGDDITSTVEVAYDTNKFLRFNAAESSVTYTKFPRNYPVIVTGDWGWDYVPVNVERAAEMLIADLMSEHRVNFRYGARQAWMDTQRFEFRDGFFDSTGNLDVDMLLLDYMINTWEII